MDVFEELDVIRYYMSGPFYICYGRDEEGKILLVKSDLDGFEVREYPFEGLAEKDFYRCVKQDLI